jgi:NTP pyrophosphatase (non-canonical NTP hydrolase)
MNLYQIHEQMTGRLFPAYSNTDRRFLALALAGEVGELCNMIKKEWRDGVVLTEEIRDEIADIRVYLELLAKCFDIEGDKLDNRVVEKLKKVVQKHELKLK